MLRSIAIAAFVVVTSSLSFACGEASLGEPGCDGGVVDSAREGGDASFPYGRCAVASDCPESTNACYENVACEGGRCAFSVKGFDVPVGSDPKKGDCRRPACDGLGSLIDAMDDSDVPDDGNPCSLDFCIEGVPHAIHPPLDDGTPCSVSGVGGVCASGTCVPSPT